MTITAIATADEPEPTPEGPRLMTQPTAHLLKVNVQPVFVVIDDAGDLHELVAEPVTVTAKDWPTYSNTAFADDDTRAIAQQVAAQWAPPAGGAEEDGAGE